MTFRLVEFLQSQSAHGLRFVSTTCRDTLKERHVRGSLISTVERRRGRQNSDNRTAAVYLHGIESHAGWFDIAAPLLVDRGIDVFALDRRGSGLNRDSTDWTNGHAESVDEILGDVHELIELVRGDYEKVVLIGLSWGGKPAVTFALRYPSLIDGLVLITPGLKSLIDVGTGTKLKILLQSIFMPKATTAIPIQPEMFTTTPKHLDFIRGDSLRLHQATSRFFLVSRAFEKEIDADAHSLSVPTLLVLAGMDQIIDNEAVESLLQTTADGTVQTLIYEDQTHSIQFDDPVRLSTDIERWVEELPRHQEEAEKV